ncbi:MAG: response regulator [Gammaproteobacteria bacterium]|nr:response regulator [Gammaproteobacteria bacterium]MBU1440514.1 response regulator [Gammaproteobacteria bacterium]
MNVLIVDDNEAAADLLRELLLLQDHTARCVYAGRAALEAAASESFDCALLDLTLPDLPGVEVARQLRAKTADTPMLLVSISGYSASDGAGDDADLFDHHLQKPIDFDTLDRILAAHASR